MEFGLLPKSVTAVRPVPEQYPISVPFGYVPGYPVNNGMHCGVDYACPVGTPGTVCYSGLVVVARDDYPPPSIAAMFHVQPGAWGLYLEVLRPDGTRDGYAHLQSLLLLEGLEAIAGKTCYITGDSGLTYGAHLHRQVIIDGVRVQPD